MTLGWGEALKGEVQGRGVFPPRWPPRPPAGPQEPPRGTPEAPRSPQEAPREPREALKRPQEAPKTPAERHPSRIREASNSSTLFRFGPATITPPLFRLQKAACFTASERPSRLPRDIASYTKTSHKPTFEQQQNSYILCFQLFFSEGTAHPDLIWQGAAW